MSQQPDTVLNHPSDRYYFGDNKIKEYIVQLPVNDVYTIVTAESPELLSRRVRYFQHLNPGWITLGGVVISSGSTNFEYIKSGYNPNSDNSRPVMLHHTDDIYHQTLIKPTLTTAPATGGSIRQNSRKIRVQRKKRD